MDLVGLDLSKQLVLAVIKRVFGILRFAGIKGVSEVLFGINKSLRVIVSLLYHKNSRYITFKSN